MIFRWKHTLVSPWKRARRHGGFVLLPCCLILLAVGLSSQAAEAPTAELLQQARAAFEKGQKETALGLVRKAIVADPKNVEAYYYSARLHETLRQYEKAVADYDQLVKLTPRAANVYQLRGSAHFRLGNAKASIADFDKEIELELSRAPQHWQRGISLYYAGRYDDGRKQFELHQTVNRNDVENAVWHFLCVARSAGVEKARAALIPIRNDGRVPMMQVHALFAGKATVEDVLAAAKAGQPSAEELKQRLFYAHLYLGLYYEALGEPKRAAEHIAKAAGEFAEDHYMGDVARVHQKLRTEPGRKE